MEDLDGFTAIRGLDLRNNLLMKYPNFSLISDTLMNLHLPGNNIHTIEPDLLATGENLKQLYLSYNQMEAFPDFTLFPQNNAIIRVHLSGNSLIGQIINSSCFENLPRLQYIVLVKMSITDFPDFGGTKDTLRDILLGRNDISAISLSQLADLKLLKKLDLSSNNLETFPNVIGVLMNLQYLDLQKNPLTCTQSNYWINSPGNLQVSHCAERKRHGTRAEFGVAKTLFTYNQCKVGSPEGGPGSVSMGSKGLKLHAGCSST